MNEMRIVASVSVMIFLFQVKTVSHDSSQLMKILHTINSLVYNKSLFLEVQPFVSGNFSLFLHQCILTSQAPILLNKHFQQLNYAFFHTGHDV